MKPSLFPPQDKLLFHRRLLASEAAICKARQRIGFEPLKKLFDQIAGPIATRTTRGAWFHGRRLVTLDGSTLQVQDSSANARAFGRPATAKRPAAYPVIRLAILIENGTRAPMAAVMDRYSVGENTLATRAGSRVLLPRAAYGGLDSEP